MDKIIIGYKLFFFNELMGTFLALCSAAIIFFIVGILFVEILHRLTK